MNLFYSKSNKKVHRLVSSTNLLTLVILLLEDVALKRGGIIDDVIQLLFSFISFISCVNKLCSKLQSNNKEHFIGPLHPYTLLLQQIHQ